MGLLGTLLGGSLGLFLFGPLGAIIGGAIGSNLDRAKPHPGASRPAGRPFNPLEAQQAFLIAMISLAAKVAKADGRVTPAEIRSFDLFLQHNLNMPADERRVAARIFNEARDSTIPAANFARQIRDILGNQPQRMRDLVTLLLMIALADGRLDPAEEQLIREINRELGLASRDYEDVLKSLRPAGSPDSAYATLGLTPEADNVAIKTAYRKLAKEYHPDVLAGRGLSEDFQKYAAEKMSSINAAYDSLRKARSF